MTALLLDEEIPAGVVPSLSLPDVFEAQMTDTDEPVHGQGDLCDPSRALPGDYVLSESGNWLRVLELARDGEGWLVTAGHLPGIGLPVRSGHQIWVWPAVGVMAWACLGESAGAR